MERPDEPSGQDRPGKRRSYRMGAAIAALASLLIVWTTIVRDDGSGAGFFMVIGAALVGAFAADFRPAGMARAMLGVAILQAIVAGLAITAPDTARIPGARSSILLFSSLFIILWLACAASFRSAARHEPS